MSGIKKKDSLKGSKSVGLKKKNGHEEGEWVLKNIQEVVQITDFKPKKKEKKVDFWYFFFK